MEIKWRKCLKILIFANIVIFIWLHVRIQGDDDNKDSNLEMTKKRLMPEGDEKIANFKNDSKKYVLNKNKNTQFNLSMETENYTICTSPIKPVDTLINIPEDWKHVENRKVMIYSAFYESRKHADGPSIRIIAAGFQKEKNVVGNLYCILWYQNQNTPTISVLGIYQVIARSTLHSDQWCSHFIICKIPVSIHDVPYAVSVTPEPCSDPLQDQTMLKVNNRDRYYNNETVKNDTFGVCISPLYHHRNMDMSSTVIEMLEIYRILGASEFTFYSYSLHKNTAKVLETYKQDPNWKVNVLPWTISKTGTYLKSFYFLQRAAFNDCLYRTASRNHKFAVVHDIDEVIVPRAGETWQEIFFGRNLYKSNIGAYIFQHYYFRRNTTNAHQNPYNLITQGSLYRIKTVYPAGKIRSKSIYNMDNVVSIDVHSHFKLIPGSQEYVISPEVGVLHHYRKDPSETFRKYPENFEYVEDRYMVEHYGDRLTERFLTVKHKLNI